MTPPTSSTASRRLTQRKRAPIACQFCRLRKTKCDGVKPVCGFCTYHEAQCVWGAVVDDPGASSTEKEILRRLDELKSMLSDKSLSGDPANNTTASAHNDAASTATGVSRGNALTTSADHTTAFLNTRCESILSWSIFQDVIEPADMAIESFAVEYGQVCSSPGLIPETQGSRHAVQEHLFVPLCRRFLDLVHVRNPILEEEELIRYAKRDLEHGIQWDSPSCLVLTACALASYTAPWHWAEAGIADGEGDASIADTFYMAAKKRHGLLGWNLIDIQCLFFASVYEKIALRPLQAWSCIQQASLRLQSSLKRRNCTQAHPETTERTIHDSLMQRVFWAVYKAEQELLPELPFCSSGIEDLTRADSMFPTPPPVEPTIEDTSSDHHHIQSQEQSWAFYLAEISIRRTMSDTIVTLYRKGEHYWLNHVRSFTEQCVECEAQIEVWYSHLPASIRFDRIARPKNELAYYLQARFYQWRIVVLRPLLYYVFHRPDEQDLSPQITTYAQELRGICKDFIVRADHGYRHGGTWFGCRINFTCAMLILGMVVKADPLVPPPPDWKMLVEMVLSTLTRWQAHSLELQMLCTTLRKIFTAISGRSDLFID